MHCSVFGHHLTLIRAPLPKSDRKNHRNLFLQEHFPCILFFRLRILVRLCLWTFAKFCSRIMRSVAHRWQDLVPADLIKPIVLARHSILTFMWEQHHVATSAFERNDCFQMWAERCQARAEQCSCWVVWRVGNQGRISKDTMGGWTSAGSLVKFLSDWDEHKRWQIVCPWVEGEEAEPITTHHIICGDWENSGWLFLAWVAREASGEWVDTCNSVREGGLVAWLRDNTSLS